MILGKKAEGYLERIAISLERIGNALEGNTSSGSGFRTNYADHAEDLSWFAEVDDREQLLRDVREHLRIESGLPAPTEDDLSAEGRDMGPSQSA